MICSARYLIVKGNSVLKVIPKFKAYSKKMKTSLKAIERAYEAASTQNSLADPCLIMALEGPEMHRTSYQVLAGPLGYSPTFDDEQVSMSITLWFSLQCMHKASSQYFPSNVTVSYSLASQQLFVCGPHALLSSLAAGCASARHLLLQGHIAPASG